MNTFDLVLQSPRNNEKISNVASFQGEDASGKFGILANHARFITSLEFSLCNFKKTTEGVLYLAVAGGILYFADNILTINTRDYLYSSNYHNLMEKLENRTKAETELTAHIKENLQNMDKQLMQFLLRNTGKG